MKIDSHLCSVTNDFFSGKVRSQTERLCTRGVRHGFVECSPILYPSANVLVPLAKSVENNY